MLSWKFLKQVFILVSGLVLTAWLLGLGHLWLQLLIVGSISTFAILSFQEFFPRLQKRVELWLFYKINLRWKAKSLRLDREDGQTDRKLLIFPYDGELVKPKRGARIGNGG
jgi:hypothetical protein